MNIPELPYRILTETTHCPEEIAPEEARYVYYSNGKAFYYDIFMDDFEASPASLVSKATAREAIAYAKANNADFVCFEGIGEIIWRKGDTHDDWTPAPFKVTADDKTVEFDNLWPANEFAEQHPDAVITYTVQTDLDKPQDVILHISPDGQHGSYITENEAHLAVGVLSFIEPRPETPAKPRGITIDDLTKH